MNASQARLIPIFDILHNLGFLPTKGGIRNGGNRIWYNSPLHVDHTASFVINVPENTWHDFALTDNNHGTPLDLMMKIKQLDFKSALQELAIYSSTSGDNLKRDIPCLEILEQRWEAPVFRINSVTEIKNPNLIDYFTLKRGIPLKIATNYCQEVSYHSYSKSNDYYGIGFKNNLGIYEIRNEYFKGTLGVKTFTYIKGKDSSSIDLFEGFTDFLSKLVIENEADSLPENDAIVLNSLSLYRQAELFLIDLIAKRSKQYDIARLWFDNSDPKAMILSNSMLLPAYANCIQPMNHLYEGFDDVNDFLVNNGK